MKLFTTIVGALFILCGAVFILQALSVLPGSFMTGHIEWAGWGTLIALVGMGVVALGRRGR